MRIRFDSKPQEMVQDGSNVLIRKNVEKKREVIREKDQDIVLEYWEADQELIKIEDYLKRLTESIENVDIEGGLTEEDKQRLDLIERVNLISFKSSVVMDTQGIISDADILSVKDIFLNDVWKEGETYRSNQVFLGDDNYLYRVVSSSDVVAQGHQPPSLQPAMSAVYRRIADTSLEQGTLDNPIPYIDSMDVEKDKYYIHKDKIYQAQADLKPCVWAPDTGIWQWLEIK